MRWGATKSGYHQDTDLMPHTLQDSGQRALFLSKMTVALAPEEGVWARQKGREARQSRVPSPSHWP